MRAPVGNHYTTITAVLASIMLTTLQLFSQPLGSGYDKFLGNIFDSGNPPDQFESYWNQVTPTNAGKWGSVEATRDVYTWNTLDQMYEYCIRRGIPLKYHCLVWKGQQPSWITSLDSASQAQEVEEFIRLVGERYPKLFGVDVVNEPLPGHNQADYRNALGGAGTTGWDWVITAFRWARQYCAPEVKLILNDFGIINDDNATTSYLTIINLLKNRGLIDGIGVQAHRFELEGASTTTIKRNLDRLAATGIPIYISEFDVTPHNTTDEAIQKTEMQRVFPVLWTHPDVLGITFWGYLAGTTWQTGAELLNADGSERLAMKWLRDYLTASGSYRSHQSGRWNDLNTWERFDGTVWNTPAITPPSPSSQVVSVKSGDTVTVASTDSIDQLWLSQGAALLIDSGTTLTVRHGDPLDVTGADMFINGSVKCYGTLASESGASIFFGSNSSYQHEQNGGALPKATWSSGSTCILDHLTNTAPANGNQSFFNITWNCPAQNDNLSLRWNGITIGGTVTIQNTGSAAWQFCTPAGGEKDTVRIEGDIIQSGGQAAACASSSAQASATVYQKGNFRMTGGTFSLGTGTGGECIWRLNGGYLLLRNAVVQNDFGSDGKFIFGGNGIAQSLTLSGVTYGPGGLPIEVDSGAVLNMGTGVVRGDGRFGLNAGSTIQTGNAGGLDSSIASTGIKSFSTAANYVFNGIRNTIAGRTLPDTVAGLTINCSAGVTLSKNLVVTDTVNMKRGSLLSGGNVLAYGPEATLTYSGFASQTSTDAEFPATGGPKNLTVGTENGLTLHASRTIGGTVAFQRKITLGGNSLTASSASGGGTAAYALTSGEGSLALTSVGAEEAIFPVGTANAYTPVWIGNTGTPDTLAVRVEPDAGRAAFGGRVTVRWTVSENTPGGGNYSLKFGWTPAIEDALFAADRVGQSKIFLLADSTEAGTGAYTKQVSTTQSTVLRSGITTLGAFGVGRFGTVTSEIDAPALNTPGKFELSQNYPNPFNPATTIVYTLPKQSKVTVEVFDMLGRRISTLVDATQPAGEYSTTFDASRLASGVYVYKMSTPSITITKKMMLVK